MRVNEKFLRDKQYRQSFFEHHKGLFGGRIYICAYCGKPMTKKNTTVDHLIPVGQVKSMGVARIMMRCQGMHTINDISNLVASCRRCNSAKGAKMGLWLLRGMVGRHYLPWLLLWGGVICFLIYSVIPCFPYLSQFIGI